MRSIRSGFGARGRSLGALAKEETDLSKEAAAAIGAGDKAIPLPKKEGEVPANVSNGEDPVAGDMDGTKGKDEPKDKNDIGSSAVKKEGELEPQLSNGEDPTVSVATGGDKKPKDIAGTAGALESKPVKAPKRKFSPVQRARIKVALEDDGMTSEEAEAEIRKQEEGEVAAEPAAAAPEVPAAEVPPVEGAEVPPAAVAPEGAEVPEVPPVAEPVVGDPAEAAAGAEAVVGEVPGDGGSVPAAEVPAGGEEAAAGLGDVPGSEAPLGDVPPAGDVPAEPGAVAGELGGDDDIDPIELDNARRLVARAEGRSLEPARVEGGELGAPDAGAETGGLDVRGGAPLPSEVEVEAGEIEDSANGLETELAEVAETSNDVDIIDERIEEGTDVVGALEQYREMLKTAMESGGIDRHGARSMQIGMEHMFHRLEIDMPYMLSLESFGGTSKKISATQQQLIALESGLKQVWAKIVEAIKKGAAFFMQLVDKIFNAVTKLEARANSLAQKAQATQGNPAAREFEDQSLAERIAFGGKVGGVEGMQQLLKFTQTMYQSYPQDVAKSASNAKIVGGAVQSKNFESLQQLDQGNANTFLVTAMKVAGQEDGMNVMHSPTLPGNKVVAVHLPTSLDGVANIKASIEESTNGSPTNGKVPVLALPQAGTLAKLVAQLAGELKKVKPEVQKATQVKNEWLKIASGLASGNFDESGDLSSVRALVTVNTKILDQPFGMFNVYALNAAKAQLDYVEKSLAQYGAAAPAAKPTGAPEAPAKV